MPLSTSSKIACETASRAPSESVNSSLSAFRGGPRRTRVVSGIEYPCIVAGQAPPFAVLESVQVAALRARVERDPRHLAGRVRMVRRELATRLGLREAATPGGEHDGTRVDLGPFALHLEGRRPTVLARTELRERVVRELGTRLRLERLPQRPQDRVTGAVADLEEPPRRPAAARGGSRRSTS